ncbi:AI-2E family transporter [Planktothrix sp. FACHB-1355]|uniref:AI-2E family transporter n=1 Tax=Aerosakkonema funiforme FACHB-1375 TaxID=2949571 RepID=A0A926VEV7_9CYAN|nr:AI-2E family transporter [Aerosakkonema funiforme]MBD2182428.1 AI-2E family transporter [Aerosakkonema funiforme FACHB-1375]MBD3561489.1 AI-2E family transporter [Planktothrix sp. FACHB-1355]
MKLGQAIGLLLIAICLYILWQIRQVILLVFAAVVLATALNRLARRLQQSRLSRLWAVMLSIAIMVIVLIGFFLLIVPPFVAEVQQLVELFPKGVNRINQWLNLLRNNIPTQFNQYLPDINSLSQQLQPVVNQLLGGSVAFFSNTLGGILSFLLVLVLTLMMLAQPQSYRKTFVRLFPSFYRRRVDGILDQCEVALGRWIIGALISMSVVALLSVVGLSILGVRLALAQGVLAGLLNFIPNIGPTLSVVLPMTIALLDAPWKSVAVLIVYFFIQQFESNFLTPYVMAQQVALLPAITLMSQVFFATFFGFLGLILALPLTVVGQVWVREVLIKDILDVWHSDRQLAFESAGIAESESAAEADRQAPVLPEDSPKTQQKSSVEDDNTN